MKGQLRVEVNPRGGLQEPDEPEREEEASFGSNAHLGAIDDREASLDRHEEDKHKETADGDIHECPISLHHCEKRRQFSSAFLYVAFSQAAESRKRTRLDRELTREMLVLHEGLEQTVEL